MFPVMKPSTFAFCWWRFRAGFPKLIPIHLIGCCQLSLRDQSISETFRFRFDSIWNATNMALIGQFCSAVPLGRLTFLILAALAFRAD
jgi:hypothetical protein